MYCLAPLLKFLQRFLVSFRMKSKMLPTAFKPLNDLIPVISLASIPFSFPCCSRSSSCSSLNMLNMFSLRAFAYAVPSSWSTPSHCLPPKHLHDLLPHSFQLSQMSLYQIYLSLSAYIKCHPYRSPDPLSFLVCTMVLNSIIGYLSFY